jgi:cobalt-zinc-cadmium efflux system outer membrane protein
MLLSTARLHWRLTLASLMAAGSAPALCAAAPAPAAVGAGPGVAPTRAVAGPRPVVAPVGLGFVDDPALQDLVRQTMATRPELRQGRARVEAERARVPQVRTLSDPLLTLGLQNDGFSHLQLGKMETSWATIMASQSFPWLGKRDLRAGLAETQARRAEAALGRIALGVRAEVERAYLDLLQVRAEIELLARTDALWSQSEGIARTRYETGDGVQSDLLRAQLARNRLRLRVLGSEAEATRRLLVLNRLRGAPASESLPAGRRLVELADPPLTDVPRAIEEARAESPELRVAAIEHQRGERQEALVRTDFYPDITVSAGVMPRGGPFETMWQAGVSLSLPVWSLGRTADALAEVRARRAASDAGTEAIDCLLEQRVRERQTLLAELVEALHIYRSGLLIQSEATVASTLAQYRVGKVPITSVLDAMAGYLGDTGGYLESIAAAQRLAIAEREVSLADAGSALGASGGFDSSEAGGGRATGASEGGAGISGPAGASPGGAAAAPMSKM